MNAMRRAHRATQRGGGAWRGGVAAGSARAFTIVEITVVVAIIALLAGILLAAIRHVKRSGDVVSEVAEVAAFQKGVEQYKQEFNTLPPLVRDTPTPTVDVGTGRIHVWTVTDLADPNTTLNNGNRYSVYSLPYYICGALDATFDGVDGLGMTEPSKSHDGTFSRRGRKVEPLVEVSQHKTRTGVQRLYFPSGTATPLAKADCVILDRWSDGTSSNSRAIRYYRWEPTFYVAASVGGPNVAPRPELVGQVKDYNVPAILGIPANKPELRDARYAIVSAGPDRDFGDSDPAARADNIVEIGR